jgi:hypothetical protein
MEVNIFVVGTGVHPEAVQLLLHGHLYHRGLHEGLRPRHQALPLRQVTTDLNTEAKFLDKLGLKHG